MLDGIEEMAAAALPPSVARRMASPVEERYETTLVIDGVKHYLFLQAELYPAANELRVVNIGVVPRPT